MGWFSSSEPEASKRSASVGTQTAPAAPQKAPANVLDPSSNASGDAQATAGCPVAHDASPDAFRPSRPTAGVGSNGSGGGGGIGGGDGGMGVVRDDRIGRIDPRNQMPVESQRRARGQTVRLSTARTTSTIPKGDDEPLPPGISSSAGAGDSAMAGCPAHAASSGAAPGSTAAAAGAAAGTTAEGAAAEKWEYPSPQQFFNAVLRKGFTNTRAEDVPSMVLIHNAVNERAWHEILHWEAKHLPDHHPQRGSLPGASASPAVPALPNDEQAGAQAAMAALAKGRCPAGIRLLSFKGDSSHVTPKARLLTLMGYTKPFDTHFWTVDRCGRKVEYVIDFYKGKSASTQPTTAGKGAGSSAASGGRSGLLDMPSFYLDVRPAGVQGIPARLARAFGF